MDSTVSLGWGRALAGALRASPRQCASALASLPLLAGMAAAALLAWGLGFFLKNYCELVSHAHPYHQIAASIIINLLLLGVWLALVPGSPAAWGRLRAWLQGCFLGAGAFAGLYFSGHESPQTMLALWLLTAAQGAVLCAACGVGAVLFGSAGLARQGVAVLLAFAVTALFWSKTPIQSAQKSEDERAVPLSDVYYDAVLKLSPPIAASAVWYQESDVSRRKLRTEGAAFDIIRGPKTYEIWVGSYTILPYPAIYPKRDVETQRLDPGLVLSLLLWGFPALVLGDVLLFALERRRVAA